MTLGSHYCPTCKRQVSTTEVTYRGFSFQWFLSFIMSVIVLIMMGLFFASVLGGGGLIVGLFFGCVAVYVFFNPWKTGFRCDFCGQIVSDKN